MKETVITTSEALKMALGMSALELVIALLLIFAVGFLLREFYKELRALVRALDDDSYERYLVASGQKRSRRSKPVNWNWKAGTNANDETIARAIIESQSRWEHDISRQSRKEG